MSLRRAILFPAAITITVIFVSCSTGPPAPQKGTPAFYWSAARETFSANNYVAALDDLGQILRTDNEFVARALPWRLILSSGMTEGYMELADSFEHGARMRKTDPADFRRQMSAQRGFANQVALQFAETYQTFSKSNKDPNIVLDFPFPTGNAAPVPEFFKIGAGIPIQPVDVENAQNRSLQRSVLLATCEAVGAPDDAAKAQQIFKAGNVQTPRNVFVLAIAKSLYEIGGLYGSMKLDIPDKQKLFYTNALAALETLPESKETKQLSSKIQAELKKKKAS
jgi:hypothetical protein